MIDFIFWTALDKVSLGYAFFSVWILHTKIFFYYYAITHRLIEWFIQSSRKGECLLKYPNMEKAALEWFQCSRRVNSLKFSKRNGEVTRSCVCLVHPEAFTTLTKSLARALLCNQTVFLSKEVATGKSGWQSERWLMALIPCTCTLLALQAIAITNAKVISSAVYGHFWYCKQLQWLVCFHYNEGSNPAKEAWFLEFFMNLV